MTTLALSDEHAHLGKIANNLEFAGEAEAVITGFTLPLDLQVPRSQLIDLMGEEFDRAVWTFDATGMIVGVDWARRLLPLALEGETYVGVAAMLILGGRELEFADSRVSKIELLAFGNGGISHIKLHLYVRPGIGSENLLLQEYQEHEVSASMRSGKLRVKADKRQQQLPLDAPASVDQAAQSTPAPEQNVSVQGECNCAGMNRDDGLHEASCPAFVAIPCGTPEEEREKAHAREREIAQRLEQAHLNGDGPGDDDAGDDDDDEGEMSGLGRQIARHAAKSHA